MIKYPIEWDKIGIKVNPVDIYNELCSIIESLNINNISLSGGIDSSILLSIMTKVLNRKIECFTVALNNKHPDYLFSKMISDKFNAKLNILFLNKKCSGDENVRYFYEFVLREGTSNIIAGDGIDELSCGYYDHVKYVNKSDIYYSYLNRLVEEQLIPLNKNSRDVNVFLPYLDARIVEMLLCFPLKDKIKNNERKVIINSIAKNYCNIPDSVINRWKYGFCSASEIKIPRD